MRKGKTAKMERRQHALAYLKEHIPALENRKAYWRGQGADLETIQEMDSKINRAIQEKAILLQHLGL